MFPVKCNGCGCQLNDVHDLPCPKCGCNEATVSMAARAQAASSGRAAAVGHQTIGEPKWNWPIILLLIAVILISGIPAYFLKGWTSVIVSWLFSALSAVVGYYAITKILRTTRVF
jgi:hypothetical protein